jgi:hypothetical protein
VSLASTEELGPCPQCREPEGEIVELGSGKFRFYGNCRACPFMTSFARTRGVAAKLWNDAKTPT